MPIVTIELNNQSMFGNERINAEFTAYKMLSIVFYASFIKHGISQLFEFVWVKSLLIDIHFYGVLCELRRSIPAFVRAELIRSTFNKRWRPRKLLAARFTFAVDFVSSLPLVCMSRTTKVILAFVGTAFSNVKGFSAKSARNFLACLWLTFFYILVETIFAAILRSFLKSASNRLSATYTNYRDNLAHWFSHRCIIPLFSAYTKPAALLEHAIQISTRPGATVLDCFMGHGSTGKAAKKLQRHFVGIEKDGNYFQVAKQGLEQPQAQSLFAEVAT